MTVSRKPPVFVRDATGLVRSLTWFDGAMLNTAGYNMAIAAFIIFGWGSWLYPGADMGITVGVLGFLITFPMLIAYSFLVMGMPRTGGDYIFASRTVWAPLGAGTAFVSLIFWAVFSFGQNAFFTTTTVLSPGLAIIGYGLNSASVASMASVIIQPWPLIIIGLVMIAAAFFFTLIQTSILHKVILILSIIGLLGYPVLYVGLLAFANNAAFQQAFTAYAAGYGTSYTGIMDSAVKAGAQVSNFSLLTTLTAIPMVMATLGFPSASTYGAGETKRPTYQVPMSMLVCIVVVCISTYIMGGVTYGVFGFKFIQATAFYGFSGVSGYPLPAPPFTNLFFGIMFPNVPLNVFMMISAVAWELLIMIMNAFIGTRVIFALAFDRVIPAPFAVVSERFHTPVLASVIVALGSIFFLVATVDNFLVTYMNLIVGVTSIYLVVMIGATILPYAKKELFESFPPTAKSKVAGIPVISITGFIGILMLLLSFYYEYNSGVVGESTGAVIGTIAVGAVYLFGIVIYYVAKAYRAREGIDLSLAFKQIPPE